MNIFEELLRLKRDNRTCALAMIVQTAGSSPRKEGSKMLIRDDGSIMGSLGGGCMEAQVVHESIIAISEERPRTVQIDLREKEGGMVCGGRVLVYIEPVLPDPFLVILGAGHVGKALARAAKFTGFRVAVTDDREDHANRENIPDGDDVLVTEFQDVFSKVLVDRRSAVVVATRGHTHDLDALRASLETDAGYIGLLGSRRKKALLFRNLMESGFSEEDMARVHVPVGLPIGAVTPEEIAISILAEIIQMRRQNVRSDSSSTARSRCVNEDGPPETAAPPGQQTCH